jgi:hypothetical protein
MPEDTKKDETKAPTVDTKGMTKEEAAAAKEEARAEAQRQLARRLEYGPIRDPE